MFFDAVAGMLGEEFTVYTSEVNMGVLTSATLTGSWRKPLGPMKRLVLGAEWQQGAWFVPISRGDVVIISGAPRCLSNVALLMKARLFGARVIWWGQLWSATTRRHRFIVRLALMRLAHAVLFYTDVEVAVYSSGYGRKDSRPLGALNNGIDVKPIQSRRVQYKAALRGNTLLFIGRLTEKAQIALLLQAMTHSRIGHATLHIIGDGPDASVLESWARKSGLEERVVWHGGTIDEDMIAAIANQSAVFCYPGGVGLSLMHAMAYGLPAVVHDDRATHMPEIAAFEDRVTGRCFRKDDPQALAEVLAELLADSAARVHMSQEALRRTDTMYNTDIMAERFAAIIQDIRGTIQK